MPDLPDKLSKLPLLGPYALCSLEWKPHIAARPGVYRLRALDAELHGPRVIPRLAMSDPEGILHIGESGNLRRRIAELRAAVLSKPSPHRAGWEYSEIGYDFTESIAPEALVVDVLHVDTKPLAEAIELALCERYRWHFKDRPPLSGSSGKYRKVASWLESLGRPARDGEGWLNIGDLLPE